MNYMKGKTGNKHPQWKGGRTISGYGHILIFYPRHLYANHAGYVPEHRLIAFKILGKPLPKKAVVHHINGNPSDNKNSNLTLCENQSYHRLLHWREQASKVSGNPNYRKCWVCGEYDDPQNLYISPKQKVAYHINCYNERRRQLKIKKANL